MANLILAVALEHDVQVLGIREDDEPPIDPELVEVCERTEQFLAGGAGSCPGVTGRRPRFWRRVVAGLPAWASHCRSPQLADRLRTVLDEWRPHVVQFEYHVMGQYEAQCRDSIARKILNQHEPGVLAAHERYHGATASARVTELFDLVAWRRYERRILRRMDAVVTFTSRDADRVRQAARGIAVECIPLGVTLPSRPLHPRGTEAGLILFVGNYKHPPNVKAALRLAGCILPRVRESVPSARLVLAGAAPPDEIRRLHGAAVTVTGEVPSVEPYLDAAEVVAAPLYEGGGMRVKVLEALAAGKAVVATPLAVEGLSVRNGEQVMIAEDDAGFAAAVIALLLDMDRRQRLGSVARSWAERAHGWKGAAARYGELYERLLARDA